MSDEQNTFDIQQSNVQILPNAKYAIQNFYGAEYARKVLSNRPCNKEQLQKALYSTCFTIVIPNPVQSPTKSSARRYLLCAKSVW